MIQDIEPLVYDNVWRKEEAGEEDIVLAYDGKTSFMKTDGDGSVSFPTVAEYPFRHALTYLFSISGKRYFWDESGETPSLPGFAFRGTGDFRTAQPKVNAFAGVTGWQLANWYRSRAYCGRCGAKTRRSDRERMVVCPECGQTEYPKLCPAVIIGVCDGDRIVLTQYAGRTVTHYSLVAGFTEIGETLEETVAREVMEEVGLHVKNVRYYKSQPWSFTDTVLMGFFCDLDGDDAIRMDSHELKTAKWVAKEDIAVDYQDLSLTNEMICYFAGKLPAYVTERTRRNALYGVR